MKMIGLCKCCKHAGQGRALPHLSEMQWTGAEPLLRKCLDRKQTGPTTLAASAARRQRCRANIADAKEPKQYWAYAGGRKMGKIVESLASGRLFDWKTHRSSEKVFHFTSHRRSHLHSPNICLGVVCSFLFLQSHLEIWQCAGRAKSF